MTARLVIECGPVNSRGCRFVVATLNGLVHRDKFDVDSDFGRRKFREAVIERFCLPDDAHDAIERDLIAAADAEDARSDASGAGRWRPTLVRLADVAARPVQWLWPKRFALGRLSLLVGVPGAGKSFITCDMAARTSTGSPWPDGGACPRGSVLLLTAEDDAGDTIRPRLDAHSADASRVHLLTGLHRDGPEGQSDEQMVSLVDVDAIAAALAELRDCRLIVVDPVGSFLGARTDAHRDNEVRAVLAPLAKLAEQYGCAVVIVMHRRKSPAGLADDTALGSRAFTGIARNVWHLSCDAEKPARRLLLPGKCNLAAAQTGLAFTIGGEPAAIRWERDPVAMTADDAMVAENWAREKKHGPDAEALRSATEWLSLALAAGPRMANDLNDEWRNGHGGSKRTLDRAKKELGVITFRAEIPGPWQWRLPAKDAMSAQVIRPGNLGNLAESRADLTVFDGGEPKDAKLHDLGDVDREAAWLNDSF